jgi:Ca2+-dependent lipid-binding protein
MEEIYLNIVEARGILAVDRNGLSDPFVVVTLVDSKGNPILAGGTFKTKTIKKTLTPKWEEEFLLGEHFDLRNATTLRCALYDSDRFLLSRSEECLGVVDNPQTFLTLR